MTLEYPELGDGTEDETSATVEIYEGASRADNQLNRYRAGGPRSPAQAERPREPPTAPTNRQMTLLGRLLPGEPYTPHTC
jgi:hypothetical protein